MRGKPKLVKLRDATGGLKSPFWYVTYYDGKRSCRCSTGCEIGAEDHEAQIFLANFILERERPTRSAGELMLAVALDDYYSELLGHKDTKITDRHYAHHSPETIRQTAQKLRKSRRGKK